MTAALKDKKVWLIGASEGIGRALALQLAAAGAVLVVSARQAARLDELVSELGGPHRAAPLDVTDQPLLQRVADSIFTDGPPDIVIYNAGAYDPMPADKIDFERAAHMTQVNYMGALAAAAAVVPPFVQQRRGHIVLVGSVAGYRGLPAAIGYGASKAAVIHLAENLRCDLQRYGIKVQVVNPGFVATRLTAKNDFNMPGLITPDLAARHIVRGLASGRFEIRFPWLFTTALKLLSLLPYGVYFRLVGLIKF